MTLVIPLAFVYLPILLIPFFLPTMIITLFKKNIHSFFTLPTPTTTTTNAGDFKLQLQHHHPISSSGLGLVSATKDTDRPPNVVESAMLKPSPPASPSAASAKRNVIGFMDDIGGEVDGLMSCTESLGLESSDERRVHDHIQQDIHGNNHNDENGNSDDMKKVNVDWRSRRRESSRKVRSFPPPLTSLNCNGEPCFFLRPVRKDGRLELTQVRIHRQEILHASRHDGRLTLHLIPEHSILEEEEEDDDEEEEVEKQQQQQQQQQQQEEEIVQEQQEVIEEEEEEENEEEIGYGKEEEGRVGEWRFGNEYEGGLRRCHEMVNLNHQHHHHHHHHHGVQFHGGHHLRMCGISIV